MSTKEETVKLFNNKMLFYYNYSRLYLPILYHLRVVRTNLFTYIYTHLFRSVYNMYITPFSNIIMISST